MPGPVFLEGEIVTLRPIDRSDLDFVRRVMNDPVVWRPALDINPMNDELAEEFFETVLIRSFVTLYHRDYPKHGFQSR